MLHNYSTHSRYKVKEYDNMDTSTLFPSENIVSYLQPGNCFKIPASDTDEDMYTSCLVISQQQTSSSLSVFTNVHNLGNVNVHENHDHYNSTRPLQLQQQPHQKLNYQQKDRNSHISYKLELEDKDCTKLVHGSEIMLSLDSHNNVSKNLYMDGHSKHFHKCPDISMINVLPTHVQDTWITNLTTNKSHPSKCSLSPSQDSPHVSDCESQMTASRIISEATTFNNTFKTRDEIKPAISYVAVIAKAILDSQHKRLNLGSIYRWIEKHYPIYTHKGGGWRNSVRHNLSLYECFIKDGRCEDGKGNYWTIHPSKIEDFMRGDFRQRRQSRRRSGKKECYINMLHVSSRCIHFPSVCLPSEIASGVPTLASVHSPCSYAENRYHMVDDADQIPGVDNSAVKWYHQGITTTWNDNDSTSLAVYDASVYQNGAQATKERAEIHKQARQFYVSPFCYREAQNSIC